MSDEPGATRRITMGGRAATELMLEGLTARVVAGPDAGSTAPLRGPALAVGTAPDNDLVLSDPGVSRRHAVLTLTAEGVRVEDLGSTNGTFVGGVRIADGVIPDGAEVRVGGTQLEVRRETDSVVVFPEEGVAELGGMVSGCEAMREVFALVRQLAKTDLPVAISGETGTGKELIARALHEEGPRKARPFQVLDCGSVLPELLPGELFGHEKGAFTGADRARKGVLESAEGGTVFLDEVGELALEVQPNLLRALETRSVTPLGARNPVRVDFRIVSATNRDLRAMSREGSFRSDLVYRLCCVPLRLPPLREREGDMRLLAGRFAAACAARHGAEPPKLGEDALARLERYPWPGNVRELKNVIEAATVLCAGGTLTAKDVERALPPEEGPGPGDGAAEPVTLAEAEKQAVLRALESTRWNRKAAAKLLGISPTTIFKKIKDYDLTPPEE